MKGETFPSFFIGGEALMKKLNGKINLSRTSSNMEEDFVSIELGDRNSGKMVAKVKMSMENLAKALLGQGAIDCVITAPNNYETLGKKREVKREVIPDISDAPYGDDEFKAYMKDKVKHLEVDGWEYINEGLNSHRRKCNGYAVAFVRYVDGGDKA